MRDDPYLYPHSDVLINKRDIRDADLLQETEIKFAKARLMQGLPRGEFDYAHLKAIHQHVFQDLYDWQGRKEPFVCQKGAANLLFLSTLNQN